MIKRSVMPLFSIIEGQARSGYSPDRVSSKKSRRRALVKFLGKQYWMLLTNGKANEKCAAKKFLKIGRDHPSWHIY